MASQFSGPVAYTSSNKSTQRHMDLIQTFNMLFKQKINIGGFTQICTNKRQTEGEYIEWMNKVPEKKQFISIKASDNTVVGIWTKNRSNSNFSLEPNLNKPTKL